MMRAIPLGVITGVLSALARRKGADASLPQNANGLPDAGVEVGKIKARRTHLARYQLFVAVPHRGEQRAEVLVYEVQ
jgi:hypothetical protein